MTEALLVRLGAQVASLIAAEPVGSACRRALDGLVLQGSAVPAVPATMRLEVTARDRRWHASLDGEPFGPSSADPADLVDRIVSWCTRTVAGSPGGDVVVSLHAAGVVDASGAALVVAGSSGAGKTTVSAAALLGGWGLLSDELVGIDRNGLAVGHPKALTVKPPTDRLLGARVAPLPHDTGRHRWYVPARDLGAAVIEKAPIGAVLVLNADAGPPVRLSPAAAVVELAHHVPTGLDADRLLVLASLAQAVPVERIGRHHPDEVIGIGAALSSGNARSTGGPDAAPPAPSSASPASPRAIPTPRRSGAHHRGPVVAEGAVAVSVDDEVLVLGPDGTLVALDAVSAALWGLLDGSTTSAELASEVAAIAGVDPAGVAATIEPMLDELRRAGAVVG